MSGRDRDALLDKMGLPVRVVHLMHHMWTIENLDGLRFDHAHGAMTEEQARLYAARLNGDAIAAAVAAEQGALHKLVRAAVDEIADDERYHYKRADARVNLPLALEQCAMDAKMSALQRMVGWLNARSNPSPGGEIICDQGEQCKGHSDPNERPCDYEPSPGGEES